MHENRICIVPRLAPPLFNASLYVRFSPLRPPVCSLYQFVLYGYFRPWLGRSDSREALGKALAVLVFGMFQETTAQERRMLVIDADTEAGAWVAAVEPVEIRGVRTRESWLS